MDVGTVVNSKDLVDLWHFIFNRVELGTASAVTLVTLVRSTPPFLMLHHLSGVVSRAKFTHQTHIFHIIFEAPSLQAISY